MDIERMESLRGIRDRLKALFDELDRAQNLELDILYATPEGEENTDEYREADKAAGAMDRALDHMADALDALDKFVGTRRK